MAADAHNATTGTEPYHITVNSVLTFAFKLFLWVAELAASILVFAILGYLLAAVNFNNTRFGVSFCKPNESTCAKWFSALICVHLFAIFGISAADRFQTFWLPVLVSTICLTTFVAAAFLSLWLCHLVLSRVQEGLDAKWKDGGTPEYIAIASDIEEREEQVKGSELHQSRQDNRAI